jgi:predicted RNA-binding protein with TRAM domain
MGYGDFGGNRGRGGGGFGNRGPMVPVKVGDELDVAIEAVGEKGDGIAKIRGFVIFIPNVSEGDQVKIRVTKVFRKVGFAEVIGAGEAKAAEEEKAPEESESFGEEEETSEEPAEPEKEEAKTAEPEKEEEPSGEESDSFGDDELPEPEGEEK